VEGVRHLEVDIWWGPISREIEVCHSPGTVASILNVCIRKMDVEFSIAVFVCLNLHTVCSKLMNHIQYYSSSTVSGG
jgi:hypothetical protein